MGSEGDLSASDNRSDEADRPGPSDEQGAAMLSASVAEYDVADVRSLT